MLLAGPVRAQFSTTASTTQFVCNALGNQFGVQAFADGAGGFFSVWIDKRNGNSSGLGTGIYAQHLDAAGVALLPANGLRLFQTGPIPENCCILRRARQSQNLPLFQGLYGKTDYVKGQKEEKPRRVAVSFSAFCSIKLSHNHLSIPQILGSFQARRSTCVGFALGVFFASIFNWAVKTRDNGLVYTIYELA